MSNEQGQTNSIYLQGSSRPIHPEPQSSLTMTAASNGSSNEAARIEASMECKICHAAASMNCHKCKEVWVCSKKCRTLHSIHCLEDAMPIVTGETLGQKPTAAWRERNRALEMLLDVTFRRARPTWERTYIDYARLDNRDMESLANLTLVEFKESLKEEIAAAWSRTMPRDAPRAFDVFMVNWQVYSQGGKLAVYRPGPETGRDHDLTWYDEDDNLLPNGKVETNGRRVASLSTCKSGVSVSDWSDYVLFFSPSCAFFSSSNSRKPDDGSRLLFSSLECDETRKAF